MSKKKDPRLERAGVSGYNKPKRTPSHPKKSHVVVAKEGDKINQDEAEHLLQEEMPEYEGYINDMVTVPLKQCQFDALVCWVYNLGPTNLGESTLLKLLNAGDYHTTPTQIKRWNKAGGKTLQGLIRRREAEALLFEGKEWIEV